MKPTKTVTFVYLILFKLIYIKCYGLDESGLCILEGTNAGANICDSSNNLVFVSESEHGCLTKCWCILIDNRNRVYDGNMEVELVQMYNSDNLHGYEGQFAQVKSYITFRINLGLNRFIVQPYTPPEALTNITSIKIHNNEICKLDNSTRILNSTFQEQNFQITTNNESNEEYRFFADCMHRKYYTANSLKYCPSYRPEFMIEKRFSLQNKIYWCININNDNYAFTWSNHLHIVYSNPNRRFVYSPLDSYIERGSPGSDFHLGSRRTIIAISEYNNQLTDLSLITIDGQPICSYFDPPAIPTTTTPLNPVIISNVRAMLEDHTIIVPTGLNTSYDKLTDNMSLEVAEPIITPAIIEQPIYVNPVSSTNNNCGIKLADKIPLISHGKNTKPGDWPWHAAIYKLQSRTTNRNFICGGTLIDRKTIVTAAHCVSELNLVVIPERLIVELGRYDLNHAMMTTQEYSIYDVIPHESYNPDTFENDIAILVLANYVQITHNINYICLPSPSFVLQDKVGTTVGWGRDHNNKLQTELKEATLPVVSYITCLESNREFFGQYLSSTNYCAGFRNNTNVCRGDSGGGLVFKHNRQWFLGGITSFGVSAKSVEHECDIKQYVIFTDVTKFLSWIKSNS